MILFFIFYRFHQILCASSEKEIGRCDALFQCGDVTAGFPFSGRNRPEVCGHPLLRLHCINNITSLIISNQEFYVLKINKTSNTLTLARPDLLGSFCSSTFTKVTLPTEIFELSPTYKSVNVFDKLHYRYVRQRKNRGGERGTREKEEELNTKEDSGASRGS